MNTLDLRVPQHLVRLTVSWPSVSVLLAALGASGQAAAQCTPQWLTAIGDQSVVYYDSSFAPAAFERLANDVVFAAPVPNLTGSVLGEWNGTAWGPIRGNFQSTVEAVAELPGGGMVVSGRWSQFTTDGFNFTPAQNIARWDGASWSAITPGLGQPASVLLPLANGDLIAGGFNVANGSFPGGIQRWDGTSWQALGTGVAGTNNPVVYSALELPNGDIVIAGIFTSAGGVPANRVARWDGTSWHAMGNGFTTAPSRLRLAPNGDLLILANSRIYRWTGTTWANYTTSRIGLGAWDILPNGDIIAVESPTNLVRWSGSSWTTVVTSAVSGGTNFGPEIQGLVALSNGNIVVTGDFTMAGGVPANHFAEFGCPTPVASYQVFGAGCPGSLGVPGNVAAAPPRLGQTLSVDFTNLAQDSVFVGVGFNNTVYRGNPLPLDLAPNGAPGCLWRVGPNNVFFRVGTATVATFTVGIPNDVAFLGAPLFLQGLVPDATANALGMVVSDAASAVVGR